MKNLVTPILVLGFVFNGFSQTVSNDFESGDRDVDIANCWAYTGFNIKSWSAISGSYSSRSSWLYSTGDYNYMKSPWMQLGSGSISFDTRLNSSDNSYSYYIDISFIPYDENESDGEGTAYATVYTHQLTQQTTVESVSYAIPSAIAGSNTPYRVLVEAYSPDWGYRRIIIDDLSIPGTYNSDPSSACMPLQLVYDSDGDGIDDDTDEYPNDADRAYSVNFQGAGNFGTMAFEDLWPSKGDYDFNDLILDFSHTAYYNANDKITSLDGQAVVRAKGGVLVQGFGLHLPGVAPNDIESVTGQELSTGSISLAANGTETGQTNAVIILCDNIETVIHRVPGSFFNTVETNGVGTADTINYTIVFANAITTAEYEDYSLFAFKDRDEEIHKADKQPTDAMDVSLFGTLDDDSDPATGRYFRTANNLPWAIEVPEKFAYPSEKNDVVGAYNNLSNWAQSNGTASKNWYTNESGNRNTGKLYSK